MTNEILYVYKFNNSSVDLLPSFNAEFTNYTYEDVVDGTTTTRSISSTERPTSVSFMSKTNLLEVHKLYTAGMDSLYGAFYKCSKLTYVDLSYSDLSAATTLEGLFNSCSKLVSIDGLDTLDVSNVENMGGLFSGCSSLTELDVSNWDVRNNTNFGAVFRGCSKLTNLDLSRWKAINVSRIGGMFQLCSKLTYLDLSGIDVSTILADANASPSQMFYGCSSLVELKLNGWKLNSESVPTNMFYNCSSLNKVDLYDSDVSTINKIIELLNSRTEDSIGILKITEGDYRSQINTDIALNKYWSVIFSMNKDLIIPPFTDERWYLSNTCTLISKNDYSCSFSTTIAESGLSLQIPNSWWGKTIYFSFLMSDNACLRIQETENWEIIIELDSSHGSGNITLPEINTYSNGALSITSPTETNTTITINFLEVSSSDFINKIRIGDEKINNIHLGDKSVSKIYLGDELIYENKFM